MKKIIIFLIFCNFSFSQEKIESLLKKMQEAQEKIVTLKANFYQKKTSKLFLKEQELKGVLYFKKPDLIRWEYTAPENYIIFIENENLKIYYPTLKKLKLGKVSKYRGKVFSFLFAQEPLQKLKNHFIVELVSREKEEALILIPMTIKLKKYWSKWKVWIDKKNFLPYFIEIYEKDGDFSFLEFKDLRINETIEDSIFKLETPEDVFIESYTKSIE